MSKPTNPFNPGSGTQPPYLAGRDEELATFRTVLKSIEDNHNENIILAGLRGTGKTVLLNEFYKICLDEGFFPIKRLQSTTQYDDPRMFDDALKYDMSTAMSRLSVTKKIVQKLELAASKVKPKKLGIPELFYYEPRYVSRSIPFVNHIEDYLTENWPVFQKRQYKGVIFLFDEFHLISEKKSSYVLADLIGAINEMQNKGIPYCLVLSGLPKLSFNLKNARSYSERMFKTVVLEHLSKEEAALAISEPLKDSPYHFDDDLIKTIVKDTGQYPYFIQFFCKELIDNTSTHKICLNEYKPVMPTIIKHLDHSFFDPRVDSLSDTEIKLLISMIKRGEKDIHFKDILAESNLKKASLAKYLKKLETKGLVYNHKRGVYRFSLPIFQDYLTRKYVTPKT